MGSGTFGKVRIGTHTITGEKVAIKILEKDRIKDKSDVERVTREINILKEALGDLRISESTRAPLVGLGSAKFSEMGTVDPLRVTLSQQAMITIRII